MIEHQILEVLHVARHEVHDKIMRPGHQECEAYLRDPDDLGEEPVDQVALVLDIST